MELSSINGMPSCRHLSTNNHAGVPFQQRGMTRQKTLDRLLHLRILEEDGKIVGSGSGSGSGPTPSAQGQQQANKPGLRPSPRNAPPAATAATAATAAVVNASPEPPQPPQLPLPPQPQPPQEQEQQEEEQPLEKQTPTPRNNLYSNSYSSHSHTHKDINPPQPSFSMTRQGSFFNQPSSSSMRRAHDSTNSLAGSNYGSIHRKVNSGSVRGGGGRPPGLDEIQRSSSVIETSYQTTAVSQVKLDKNEGLCRE